jgi:hypothetical protein
VSAEIPQRALLAGGPFGRRLSASRVLAAIDRGLQAGGLPPSDLCPLELTDDPADDVRQLLNVLQLDLRLQRSRAVVLAVERLTLTAPGGRSFAGQVTFEIATRARQGGVPAYAIARLSTLDAFQARILDLQEIRLAGSARALEGAGEQLARIV